MKRIILIGLIFTALVNGQNFDGASLGMAGNYSAMSRGVNSLGWNPAHLALIRGNTVELNLFSLNMALFNNSFSLNDYNRYFTLQGNPDTLWSDSEKKDILNLIDENGFALDLNTTTNIFGLAFNNFGMVLQAIGQGQGGLSSNKQLLRTALFGDNLDKTYEYRADDQYQAEFYSAIKVAIGYAYSLDVLKQLHPKFGELSAGIAVNYYLGTGVAQVLKSDVLFQRIEGDDESVKYSANIEARVAKPEDGALAGKGTGYDFGLSTSFNSKWRFSMAFSNLFAKINWSVGAEKLEIIQKDSLKTKDLFEDKKDDQHKVEIDTSYDISGFTTTLPAYLSIGASYQMMPNLLITADWRQGLNKAFGNSTTPRVGVGVEYRYFDWLPLRGGLAMGGGHNFLLGYGLGINFQYFDLDLSYAMKNALWPTYSEGIFTALSVKVKL